MNHFTIDHLFCTMLSRPTVNSRVVRSFRLSSIELNFGRSLQESVYSYMSRVLGSYGETFFAALQSARKYDDAEADIRFLFDPEAATRVIRNEMWLCLIFLGIHHQLARTFDHWTQNEQRQCGNHNSGDRQHAWDIFFENSKNNLLLQPSCDELWGLYWERRNHRRTLYDNLNNEVVEKEMEYLAVDAEISRVQEELTIWAYGDYHFELLQQRRQLESRLNVLSTAIEEFVRERRNLHQIRDAEFPRETFPRLYHWLEIVEDYDDLPPLITISNSPTVSRPQSPSVECKNEISDNPKAAGSDINKQGCSESNSGDISGVPHLGIGNKGALSSHGNEASCNQLNFEGKAPDQNTTHKPAVDRSLEEDTLEQFINTNFPTFSPDAEDLPGVYYNLLSHDRLTEFLRTLFTCLGTDELEAPYDLPMYQEGVYAEESDGEEYDMDDDYDIVGGLNVE